MAVIYLMSIVHKDNILYILFLFSKKCMLFHKIDDIMQVRLFQTKNDAMTNKSPQQTTLFLSFFLPMRTF